MDQGIRVVIIEIKKILDSYTKIIPLCASLTIIVFFISLPTVFLHLHAETMYNFYIIIYIHLFIYIFIYLFIYVYNC